MTQLLESDACWRAAVVRTYVCFGVTNAFRADFSSQPEVAVSHCCVFFFHRHITWLWRARVWSYIFELFSGLRSVE